MTLTWPIVAMVLVGALLHAAHLAQLEPRNKAIRLTLTNTVIDAKGARA